MTSDIKTIPIQGDDYNIFACDSGNIFRYRLELANWLETSGLIAQTLSSGDLITNTEILPRPDRIGKVLLAQVSHIGSAAPTIAPDAIAALHALISERATGQAAARLKTASVTAAVQVIAARAFERGLEALAGGAA